MTNKKTVILQACVGTSSGYGARSRDIAWALIENENYDVKIISTPWGGTPQNFLNSSDPKHCKIIERVIQPTEQLQQPDVFIQITVPNEFQKVGTFKSIGITAGMETNLVDPSWLEGINRMDLTLCSSKHSAEVFKQNKYDKLDQNTKQKVGELLSEKEVDVLFEGIDFSIYYKTDSLNKNIVDAMADIKESFCFLTVGHWLPGQMWEDRKNMGGTIWTFLDTFKNKINAPALVLKISCGVYSEIDKHEIQKRINSIKNSFEHTATRLPNVYLLHGDLTDEEMNSVYNHPKIKAMLSMTKGEGFGRPLAEFATTGKPIIVSAYSGQPNPAVAGRYMIDTFENYKSKLEVSRKLPKHLKDNFSYDKMKETLYKWIEAPIAAPKVPQPQQLKLPQLRKIELPQLKKDRIT
jgi:glycosyltransferase involved in cell wall biosynthesis